MIKLIKGGGDRPVITLESHKQVGGCYHRRFLVDHSLNEIICRDCGAKMNPMYVLAGLAVKESRLRDRIRELRETEKRLESKRRCKCQHCGRMTKVPT